VGQAFPFWQLTAVCEDGVLVADILANRCYAHGRTRWLEPADALLSGARTAGEMLSATLRNAADYGLSSLRLKPRSDAFFQSMRGSIGAFHEALDAGRPPALDGAFGRQVVSACASIAEAAFGVAPHRQVREFPPRPQRRPAVAADVALLGGTGFIGAETV